MTREEAIEVYNGLINEKIKEAFEFFAPELRESEDERIRKSLIEFLREAYSKGNAPEECAKWLVWLDQPKEQKPAWSEKDEKTINELCDIIASNAKNGYLGGCYAPDLIEKIKSLRPSWKPNEVCYGPKGDPDPAGVCMKTPAKIYMLPEELDERSEWLTKPYEDRDIAYVRTDCLLEWASEMENCSQLSAPLLAHELIKKINSL